MRRQAGHPAPILAVDLLRRPLFALSAATAVCAFAAQALAFVSLPFLFQTVLGPPVSYTHLDVYKRQLKVRATNQAGDTQPLEPLWNPAGYMRNVVETVRVDAA